jgi:GT2 family glycosyltransferase
MSGPSVTVVVVPRERFSYARRSLESLHRNTDYPFELVYVDGNSPAHLKRYLERAATTKHFRLIRTEHFLSPNQARNIGLREVQTKYVVFLDNDVEVAPGWLTNLVSCAEESGAWAVAPVYFEGAAKNRLIHTAGGIVEFVEADGVRSIRVDHLLHHAFYDDVAPTLRRSPTGFCEFHCVLLPLEVFTKLGPLDEECLSLHEHLDLSLMIRRAGGLVYLEPKAHVTYTHGLFTGLDLEYARIRWSDDWNRRSTFHFLAKWHLDQTSAWGASVIAFGNGHREHLERLRLGPMRLLKNFVRNVLPTRLYTSLRELHN